ncbi:MAG TPA: HAD family hydrolase [Syntrophomonadaceae bacterium]|nr:HAD family hydrolase [Syntrophomonadaceae bacterium]HRX21281.1 HAD family hydrolase [Syntrophomonadaceae bacterium]
MFKAVLFDLDGTLLDIDMQQFLPHYFRQMVLMANSEGVADGHRLVEQVYKSTEIMIADKDPETTNEQAFMRDFFAATGWEEGPIQEFFNKFYAEGFPVLQKYSKPFAGIPQMMERLQARDIRVVIATNAVFPLTALKQRLAWAGLEHFEFELITSYEIMHFCKPHPEYYEEILDYLNVKAEECLMVGNDIGEDLPAGTIGMKTFLVENLLIDNGADLTPDWRGDLNAFYRFIENFK